MEAERYRPCSFQHFQAEEALTNNNWVRDINLGAQLSVTHIQQFIILWNLVATIPVTLDTDDNITWKLTQSGMYSVSSVYRAHFFRHTGRNLCPLIWKLWAPPKCKFFAWLVMRNRVWTSDRLATRGWPRNVCCTLCRQSQETAHHLLADCRYTRRIWMMIVDWTHYPQLRPTH